MKNQITPFIPKLYKPGCCYNGIYGLNQNGSLAKPFKQYEVFNYEKLLNFVMNPDYLVYDSFCDLNDYQQSCSACQTGYTLVEVSRQILVLEKDNDGDKDGDTVENFILPKLYGHVCLPYCCDNGSTKFPESQTCIHNGFSKLLEMCHTCFSGYKLNTNSKSCVEDKTAIVFSRTIVILVSVLLLLYFTRPNDRGHSCLEKFFWRFIARFFRYMSYGRRVRSRVRERCLSFSGFEGSRDTDRIIRYE